MKSSNGTCNLGWSKYYLSNYLNAIYSFDNILYKKRVHHNKKNTQLFVTQKEWSSVNMREEKKRLLWVRSELKNNIELQIKES